MNDLNLRPLTLGEILDRTFFMYRKNFLLFLGIMGIPHVLSVGLTLTNTITQGGGGSFLGRLAASLAILAVGALTYLVSQGGTVLAVKEIYLGRPASISQSLSGVWSELGTVFGVVILSGLAIGAGTVCLIIPGIYVACRVMVCMPAALTEQRSAAEALSRSFDLTKGYAGRAFVIGLLFLILAWMVQALVSWPFLIVLALAEQGDSEAARYGLALIQLFQAIGTVLVTPFSLIASSIFYFDLRVRKEAFDLQLMMDPTNLGTTGSMNAPSILG